MYQRIYAPLFTDKDFVDVAKQQVQLAEEMDNLTAWITKACEDITDIKANLLQRTSRLQSVEIILAEQGRTLAMLGQALSDLLEDLLPATDARIEMIGRRLQIVLSRLEQVDQSLDNIDEHLGQKLRLRTGARI